MSILLHLALLAGLSATPYSLDQTRPHAPTLCPVYDTVEHDGPVLPHQMKLIRQGKLHVDQAYGQRKEPNIVYPHQTALTRAIREQNMQLVAELIDRHHADVNKTSYNTPSPLQEAYETDNLTLIRHLIARGATSTRHDQTGGRTFHYACRSGNPKTIRLYLSLNTPPTAEQLSHNLHHICTSGDIELVRMALSRGANPNIELFEEAPPLCAACYTGNLELVRLLLDHGADITGHGSEETSCIDAAIFSGNRNLVQHLETLEQQQNLDLDPQKTRLTAALYAGHNHLIDHYIAQKYPIDTPRLSAKETLLLAAQNGHISLIHYLLDRKTDIHARDEAGNTPLHLASRHNHPAAALALLHRGANASLRNKNGQTALDLITPPLRWNTCRTSHHIPTSAPLAQHKETTFDNPPAAPPENITNLHQACQSGDTAAAVRRRPQPHLLTQTGPCTHRPTQHGACIHISHHHRPQLPELQTGRPGRPRRSNLLP